MLILISRPAEVRRLSRPRHCCKDAQPIHKTVYRCVCGDKHNRPLWDSNLGPHTAVGRASHCDQHSRACTVLARIRYHHVKRAPSGGLVAQVGWLGLRVGSRDAEPLKLHSGSGSGFFTGSGSSSGPAQQAKTNTTRLRLSTRCFPGGRTLCTNWLHTGADLIQGIVSYVRIKTRTLKKFFRTTLTRKLIRHSHALRKLTPMWT